MKIYILTWKEFLKELKMSYFELVGYLKKKYGMVPWDYTSKYRDTERGLFMHHIMEWWWPDLSSANGKQTFPQYQRKGYLVFCNWLEHLLLHAKIHIDSPHRIDGDKGATKFMIPQIYTYLELGKKAANISQTYYNNISNIKTALRIFKRLVVMFGRSYNNRTLINMIKEAEENLESDGKHSYAYEQIIAQCNISLPWSESEIEALRKYYPKYGIRDNKLRKILTKINGKDIRTENAIADKAFSLGIKSNSYETYALPKHVIEYIVDNYAELGIPKLFDNLSKRNIHVTKAAIRWITQKYDLSYNYNPKNWTEEDVELLKLNYPTKGTDYCAKLLNKSSSAIRNKVFSLQLKTVIRIRNVPCATDWNEEEDNVLINVYPIHGTRAVYDKLKELNISPVERTFSSIYHRAQSLGIKRH